MDSDVKKLLCCKLLWCKIKSKSVVITMLWLGDNKTKFKFKECVDWYSFRNSFRSEEEEKMDPKPIVIAVIVIALSIAIIGFIVFTVWKRNGKKPKRRQLLEKPKAGKVYWFEKTMFITKVYIEVYISKPLHFIRSHLLLRSSLIRSPLAVSFNPARSAFHVYLLSYLTCAYLDNKQVNIMMVNTTIKINIITFWGYLFSTPTAYTRTGHSTRRIL